MNLGATAAPGQTTKTFGSAMGSQVGATGGQAATFAAPKGFSAQPAGTAASFSSQPLSLSGGAQPTAPMSLSFVKPGG